MREQQFWRLKDHRVDTMPAPVVFECNAGEVKAVESFADGRELFVRCIGQFYRPDSVFCRLSMLMPAWLPELNSNVIFTMQKRDQHASGLKLDVCFNDFSVTLLSRPSCLKVFLCFCSSVCLCVPRILFGNQLAFFDDGGDKLFAFDWEPNPRNPEDAAIVGDDFQAASNLFFFVADESLSCQSSAAWGVQDFRTGSN